MAYTIEVRNNNVEKALRVLKKEINERWRYERNKR